MTKLKKIKKPVVKTFYKTPYFKEKCYDRTPYSCVWCDFKFDSIQSIEKHVIVHHGFNCNDCLKELVTWEQFLVHAKDCSKSRAAIPLYISCGKQPSSSHLPTLDQDGH